MGMGMGRRRRERGISCAERLVLAIRDPGGGVEGVLCGALFLGCIYLIFGVNIIVYCVRVYFCGDDAMRWWLVLLFLFCSLETFFFRKKEKTTEER